MEQSSEARQGSGEQAPIAHAAPLIVVAHPPMLIDFKAHIFIANEWPKRVGDWIALARDRVPTLQHVIAVCIFQRVNVIDLHRLPLLLVAPHVVTNLVTYVVPFGERQEWYVHWNLKGC